MPHRCIWLPDYSIFAFLTPLSYYDPHTLLNITHLFQPRVSDTTHVFLDPTNAPLALPGCFQYLLPIFPGLYGSPRNGVSARSRCAARADTTPKDNSMPALICFSSKATMGPESAWVMSAHCFHSRWGPIIIVSTRLMLNATTDVPSRDDPSESLIEVSPEVFWIGPL